MSTASKLSVQSLAKLYDGVPVLERVNLEVQTGSFCTIVGASGCGKSTFLRMLLSQEHPTRGQILLDGARLPLEPTPDRGIVFQKYSVFSHLTVAENLILAQEFETSRWTGRLLAIPASRLFSQPTTCLTGSVCDRRQTNILRSCPVACSNVSRSPRP